MFKPIHFCHTCKTLCHDTSKHNEHQLRKLQLYSVVTFLLFVVVLVSWSLKFKKVAVEFVLGTIIAFLSTKLK